MNGLEASLDCAVIAEALESKPIFLLVVGAQCICSAGNSAIGPNA